MLPRFEGGKKLTGNLLGDFALENQQIAEASVVLTRPDRGLIF